MMSQTIAAAAIFLSAAAGCNKGAQSSGTLLHLYREYRDGSIAECRLHGQTVYSAGINAYDAPTLIYDSTGTRLATCSYGWGRPDTLCGELQSCETIYRCANHISGEPYVDKYGLSRTK